MRKLSLITLLTVGLMATTGCNGCSGSNSTSPEGTTAAESAEDIGTVLATVNGMKIGSVEFEQVAGRQAPADGKELSAEERKEVLDRLINERVLYQEALRKGLDKDDKVKKVMVNTLLREDVYANVRNSDFTDAELEAYFETNKEDFVVPEKVQIKHILIRITEERPEAEAKALAEDIHKRLKSDPANNFRQLAIDFSEDAYSRRGGDVGFVSKEGKPGLDQAIVDKAFGMEVGELSEVFRSDSGFSIVYVAQKRERMERTFQQMKGSVLRKVKNERLNEVLEEYVNKLKADAAISIDEAALQAVDIQARGGRPTLPGFTPATPELSGAPAGEVKDLQE